MKVFILEDDPYRLRLFREACIGLDTTFATSYDAAVQVFDGPYDILCLDHDLGGESMVSSSNRNTGYSFCKWLATNTQNTTVYVHSYNPVGAENMMHELRSKDYAPIRMPFGTTLLNLLKRQHGTHTF